MSAAGALNQHPAQPHGLAVGDQLTHVTEGGSYVGFWHARRPGNLGRRIEIVCGFGTHGQLLDAGQNSCLLCRSFCPETSRVVAESAAGPVLQS